MTADGPGGEREALAQDVARRIREQRVREERGSHLLLADEFFLAAHDPLTFKRRLFGPMLDLGLSAGLVGEQWLFGTVQFRNGLLFPRQLPGVDKDLLAHEVFRLFSAERVLRPVQVWLEALSTLSYRGVEQRLLREGLLTTTYRRRLLRRVVASAADPARAGAGVSRLAGSLGRQQNLEPDDLVLVGIMHATGLSKYVLDETPDDKHGVIRIRLEKLPTRLPPELGLLVTATKDLAVSRALSGLA